LSKEPAEQVLAHASANGDLLTGCTKTSESAYGFDRNGCTEWLGIRKAARVRAANFGDVPVGSDAAYLPSPQSRVGFARSTCVDTVLVSAMLAVDRIGPPPSLLAALMHVASLHNPDMQSNVVWGRERACECCSPSDRYQPRSRLQGRGNCEVPLEHDLEF
jgi:hypothetical protein